MPTIGEAYRSAAERLHGVGETGSLDASRLIEHVTGLSHADLLLRSDDSFAPEHGAALEHCVRRRECGEPIAYIVGTAGFYGRTFVVDERVLVPRPESEHLVEAALDDLRGRRKEDGTVVDVGTGSGALGITLACELEDLGVFCTDVSTDALAVARRNAAANHVFQRCTFLHGDLAAPLKRFGRVDAVIANLPYIPAAHVPERPDPVGFEPRIALDGGADGLDLYRRLLRQLPALVNPGASIFLEAAPGTIQPLAALAERLVPNGHIEIGEDYAGFERFVSISLSD